jgi:hypothetical protein
MRKSIRALTAVLATLLFCGLTLAQEPVVNIDGKIHPNLLKAQQLIAEANKYIVIAQKDNRYDMKGNASNARKHLVEASEELKLAAEAANAANAAQKKK